MASSVSIAEVKGWSQATDESLSRALPNPVIRAIVADEVRRGISRLWVCVSEHHNALCVTRLDRNPDELCIVAFEGSGVHEFAPFFINRAHDCGIPVRAHVITKAHARLYRRVGMRESEVIMRSNPQ